ncbi:MAG TPA: hypothetical protein VGS62_01745 [Streptosporangiaceae bacterium]|nr:hypothetical protein [Streptosporangiaceae bacterium]
MADQMGPGTLDGGPAGAGDFGSHQVAPAGGPLPAGVFESHHGRPVSWVSISLICVGVLLGGVALIIGPVWWLFWTGVAVAAVGGILGLATGIFNDWY